MNILQLGLDVDTFDEVKKRTLQEFISLFDTLSKYDGKVFNPVMGGGLVEFNKSITDTSALLDDLQTKMKNLGSGATGNNAVVKQQTELSLAVNEYKKSADAAATTAAKLAVATSDQAKETMALKLQLSEVTKEMMQQAKQGDYILQQRIESINGIQQDSRYQAENNAMKMQAVNTLRQLAIEQERAEKEYNATWAAAQKEREALAAVNAEQARRIQLSIDKKLADESKAAQALTRDYEILNKTLRDQANAYSLAYRTTGKDSAATKKALDDYRATAGIVTDIDKQLGKGAGSAKLFGGALSSAFSQLRTLAYILPGIGIAGIFNLAFDAIGSVIQASGLFNDKLEEQLKLEAQVNNSLNEQFGIYKSINEQRDRLFQQTDTNSSTSSKNELDKLVSRGFDQSILNPKKIEELTKERNEAYKKLAGSDLSTLPPELKNVLKLDVGKLNEAEIKNTVKSTTASIDLLINSQNTIEDKIKLLDKVINTKDERDFGSKLEHILNAGLFGEGEKVVDGQLFKDGKNVGQGVDEVFKKRAETEKTKLQLQQTVNTDALNNLSVFNSKQKELQDQSLANVKFSEDQKLKITTDTSKENLSLVISRNQAVINNQRSTEGQIIHSLETIRDANKQINAIERNKVTSNLSSTPADRLVAENKLIIENNKLDAKFTEDREKELTLFYQRRLKATTEIHKAELDEQAIANERIYKNDENSLGERLAAYANYISLRQKMQDAEREKDLQTGASHKGGKTSLTGEELENVRVQAQTQKANTQADYEKQVYDIVSSSLQKQLKLIVDNNRLFEQNNKEEYAKELTDLNNSLVERTIKYSDYKKARLALDSKFKIQGLDASIKDDTGEVQRLSDLLEEEKRVRTQKYEEMKEAKDKMDIASSRGDKDLGYKKDYDDALGEYNAYNDAVLNSDKALKAAQDKLHDDELKRAKDQYELIEQAEKEHAANRKAILEGAANLAQTYVDSQAQREIEAIERVRATRDASYDEEIGAIEKSSLSAKDKTALDIQLSQQKKEFDAASELEERKLKHDAAVVDRDIALAKILYETEVAVMSALELPPPLGESLALERGILGGIAAATVLAAPIPSYAEGTDYHPGGIARYGEAGPEIVKEPYKSPYLVLTETVSYLPKGTEVVPIVDSPDFEVKKSDDSWEQTRWLAKQMKKNNKEVKNIFSPTINVDLKTHIWKQQILGNV